MKLSPSTHELSDNNDAKIDRARETVEQALARIESTELRVSGELGFAPDSEETRLATDAALAEVAERMIDTGADGRGEALDTVGIETAIEASQRTIDMTTSPVGILENDGYESAVTGMVERFDEMGATLPTGEDVAALVIQTVDQLGDKIVTPDGRAVVDRLTLQPDQKDDAGISRPLFLIGGKQVIFRNRQEAPELSGYPIRVVGDVAPLRIDGMSDSAVSAVDDYAHRHKYDNSPEAVLVVTNTPKGIIDAARQITTDLTLIARLGDISHKMTEKNYTDPLVSDSIDDILAAISIDDHGEDTEILHSDGFALALAALSGDKEARRVVESRKIALLENDTRYRTEQAQQRQEVLRDMDVDPVPLEQLALVHTTSHELEYDDRASIILRPAAQRRDDEYPRSTLHFTLNSRVDAHDQAQDAWSTGSTMIVANMAHIVETNHGRLPEVMNGVDTYYSMNPGEGLVFDDATVVEPDVMLKGPDLVRTEKGRVTYQLKSSDEYTFEQKRRIEMLARGIMGQGDIEVSTMIRDGLFGKLIQEIALRKALEQQHVPVELMDKPSVDGHGMRSQQIANRVLATGLSLGLGAATHFQQSHARAEKSIYAGMRNDYVGKIVGGGVVRPAGATNWTDAGLPMRRQQLVSGMIPARPLTYEEGIFAVPSFDKGMY